MPSMPATLSCALFLSVQPNVKKWITATEKDPSFLLRCEYVLCLWQTTHTGREKSNNNLLGNAHTTNG